jgi:hypothetical protein
LGGEAVGFGEPAVERGMGLLDEGDRERRRARGDSGFELTFGFDVRQGDTLQARNFRLVGEVLPQGAPDGVRMGALALDAIAVAGVPSPAPVRAGWP